ncbi:MAG: PD-(D/E)XK nuclease family protein [Actinobacteria bacterium]|nr:PD-(D/E)XK nuclease family protein [Actinomycetota bacterium]
MRLSYSAISTYQKCPLSYKFLYVDKFPTKPSHYLSFGSSIHSALEFFYSIELPEPCSLERLLEELDNVWLRDGYESEVQEQEYKEKGRAILTRFYWENLPSFTIPVAVEKRFSLDIDGITLVGVIDRIDRLANGGLEIIDYKTNDKLPPKTKINTDLQLPIYHMAAETIYGIAPQKVTLYFLVPNEKVSARKTKTDIKKAQNTIHKVASGIRGEKFDPLKNPLCPWCDFIELCPLHVNDPVILVRAAANGKILGSKGSREGKPEAGIRDLKQNATETAVKELKQSAIEIERVVDEYLELVERISSARLRLNELQSIIHNYCEANELTSISGKHGKLARRAQRVTHYNVNKLRELLEPRGLWEKIIDVNGQLLKKLLDDETSQGELRKLIDTAKEVEEISYALYIKDRGNP